MTILLVTVVLLPSLALTVSNAYQDSLIKAKQSELESMTYALIASFEIDGSQINMPFNVFDDRLNMPQSGYQALIVMNQTIVWQSSSSMLNATPLAYPQAQIGQSIFSDSPNAIPDTFLYTFTAEFESENQYIPIKFYIIEDKSAYYAELDTFNQSLLQNGLWVGLLISGMLLLSLLSVVSPVKQLVEQLSKVASGQHYSQADNIIHGDYPKELNAVKDSVNQLLLSESQQRTRFKNALQDLAHSLKTPLSVLQGDADIPSQSKAPIEQIDQIIHRQLARSVLGKAGWQAQINMLSVVDRIIESMDKIYRDKQLRIELLCSHDTFMVAFDTADAYELLGNIIDNACKAAVSHIEISLQHSSAGHRISVTDDGPGIPSHLQQEILTRGKRLDTYKQGHGIGLASVNDLLDLYGATLKITSRPEIEGTRMEMNLA